MIDVLIQTFNEELNLPHTLESIKGWVRHIYVVDSGSTDRTREIAASYGATVIEHAWEGYARQKNWALANIPFEAEWILILDADEAVSDPLREELLAMTNKPSDQVADTGFYVNRVFIFFGREIRHCGYFPSWNLRLFKRGKARYEDRLVHEHMIVDGTSGYLSGLLLHEDRRGLENFFAKHNRYSTLEAMEIYERPEPWPGVSELITNRTVRRRFGKSRILTHLPVPWIWRFIYMWIIRGGILDGRAGWYLCWSISGYEMQVQLKYRELVRLHGDIPEARDPLSESEGQLRLGRSNTTTDESATLATASKSELHDGSSRRPYIDPVNETNPSGNAPIDPRPHVDDSDPLKPIPTIVFTKRTVTGDDAKRTEEIVTAYMSPWTFGQNVKRALWMITSKLLFRTSFHNWYGWRRFLLRLFGAKIGQGVRIRPSAYIEIPWNVDIDDAAVVGDWAILYSLGKIRIGKRTVVSQYAHLCAGTHDHRYKDFPLVRPPITIGDDAWIAADAFVGPGVTIGSRSVVGARSNVFSDLPEDIVAVGSPAKPIKAREWIGDQGPQGSGSALQD